MCLLFILHDATYENILRKSGKHEQTWSIVFLEKFIDKYNDFFPPIVQHTHTIQLWVFCALFVFLPVFLHMSWYIWAELQHISARNFITLQVAQWMGMTVNHSKQFQVFFCSSRSIFNMMAPVWNMASSPSGSMIWVLSCSSSILSVLHSERCNHWVYGVFVFHRQGLTTNLS